MALDPWEVVLLNRLIPCLFLKCRNSPPSASYFDMEDGGPFITCSACFSPFLFLSEPQVCPQHGQ